MKALALCIAAVGIHFPVLAFNSTCYMPPYGGGEPEGPVAFGDTPCSPSTDDDVARACCGYSDGSICLSNGLCFVPQNNSMLQRSCTDPFWASPGCPITKCVGMRAVLYISRWDTNEGSDANLQFCQSEPEDVPAPGDSGGLWYCRTSSQSCADALSTFGIPQGYFADFRNHTSTSSAAATSTKSVPVSTSADTTKSIPVSTRADVTNHASCNASAATETPPTPEPSCLSYTGGDKTFPRGVIAGAAIGSFCAGLIASGAGILISRRKGLGKHQVMQTTVGRKDETQRPLEGGPLPELPTNRLRGAELE